MRLLKLQTRECNFSVYQTADCVGTKFEEHDSEQQDPEALTVCQLGCSLAAVEVEGTKNHLVSQWVFNSTCFNCTLE